MEYLQIALWAMAVFSVMGLAFGVALAATARRFHVESDPLVDQVRENLPSANCGACGFAGCQSYAEAVVANADVKPSLCTPGGKDVAAIVAELTQKAVGKMEEKVVMLRCQGTTAVAKQQAQYEGIQSCSAAVLAFGGPKACKNGCVGLGDCERACPFDAIHVRSEGIAEVDYNKCTGCAVCVAVCPKNILELYPKGRRVELACVSKDKPNVVRPTCSVGCVICRRCVKACPAGAVTWSGSTIVIDHDKCEAYGPSCNEACVTSCPTHILHRPGERPVPEEPKPEKVLVRTPAE